MTWFSREIEVELKWILPLKILLKEVMPKIKMPKWKKDGDAQAYLESLFESAEITPEDKPKEVYDKYAIFRDYSIDVFRKYFNMVKKEVVNSNVAEVTPEVRKKGATSTNKD